MRYGAQTTFILKLIYMFPAQENSECQEKQGIGEMESHSSPRLI